MRNRMPILAMVTLSGLCIVDGVCAQTWGGFYIDGALGARNTSTELRDSTTISTGYSSSYGYSWSDTEYTNSTLDLGDTNFLAQLSAGWRWDNGNIVLGIGAFFDLAGEDAGKQQDTFAYTTTINFPPIYSYFYSSTESFTASVKQENRYGISLDIGPSWKTHPYAKLVYSWSDFEFEERTPECGPGSSGPTTNSFGTTRSGFGIGGGIRHLHNDHLYFFAEAMWQDLGSTTKTLIPLCGNLSYPLFPGQSYSATQTIKLSPTNLTGVLGVGWRF